jgi:hypothetical protein
VQLLLMIWSEAGVVSAIISAGIAHHFHHVISVHVIVPHFHVKSRNRVMIVLFIDQIFLLQFFIHSRKRQLVQFSCRLQDKPVIAICSSACLPLQQHQHEFPFHGNQSSLLIR